MQRASDNVDDGEISFGVVDTAKFSGSLAVVPNVGATGLWEVPIVSPLLIPSTYSKDDTFVDGKALGLTNRTSITDTGTSSLPFRNG